MSNFLKITVVLLLCTAGTCSCSNNTGEGPDPTDSFDRSVMLEFWADEIIIPSLSRYTTSLVVLRNEATNFYQNSTIEELENLRNAWLNAYLEWQTVSIFDIGKAEEIGLRNYTNIYPNDISLIESNIANGGYNLELPSNFVSQGFPALDYFLFGSGADDEAIINYLTQEHNKTYLIELIDRLIFLSDSVIEDWNGGYRDAFVVNDGSSGTASTDKLVNDFLFYYERFLRAAKVGIPAGVFSGNTEADLVEGRYSKIYSKQLFAKAFSTVRKFFNGTTENNTTTGPSLKQYLDHLLAANAINHDIASDINAQWDKVENQLSNVNDDFGQQVQDDHLHMLALYDELQKAVVILKVDMLQALNIQVDFVDADGD